MSKKDDRLLSTKEAMEFLGIDWNAIYTYIAEGKLRAHKLGGNAKSRRHWRIWYSDLVAFVNQDNENVEESHAEPTDEKKESGLTSSSHSPVLAGLLNRGEVARLDDVSSSLVQDFS